MPTCLKDDDRDKVDKHRDNDNDDDDDYHHRAVETVAVESDRNNCYLALGGRNDLRRE